jgi:hypothetical protein
MPFFVKVIPPSKRARVHSGECDHCRDGQGQENQDKGGGPTRWHPAFPEPGISLAEADEYMERLNFRDTGRCRYCEQRGSFGG